MAALLAARAERSFSFWSAARWYRGAALARHPDRDELAFAWMRSARALQKAENARTQTAIWEALGNELGLQIAANTKRPETDYLGRYRSPRRRPRQATDFGVISDEEWSEPPNQSYTPEGLRRHHQASVFEWAAEVALAHRQYAEAARLYRRAGISWEKSERRDKWRRGATCYHQAALSASQTARHATRRGIYACKWCPSCLREKSTEEHCKHPDQPSALLPDGEGQGTDLERLRCCWLEAAERGSTDVLVEACRQLAAIQRQLAVAGSHDDAKAVHRFSHAFRRAYFKRSRSWAQLWLSRLNLLVSRNGSSVVNLLATLAVFYVVVVPLLWLLSDSVTGIWEAIVFSLANMANVENEYTKPDDLVTILFQVLQGLSGYFSLGVALWLSQRAYDT